jgi:soluble P-type ATPase
VFVLVDGKLKGAIALADIVRPEAKQAIAALKALNIRCLMLTGDNKATAKWVSDQVGLDEYFAEVLPQDKAAKVKEVQSRGVLVAMTGDGVNDAPALAQADVGIAIGAGSDVAVETADVILVRSNPLDVVAIVQLSRATYRKMIQNLLWATGYNVVAIPLAAGALYAWGVLLTPALGAVLMSASTVIVAINARLLRLKKQPVPKSGKRKCGLSRNNVKAQILRTSVTPFTERKHDHERIESRDQRPHLRNDRGRSHRSPSLNAMERNFTFAASTAGKNSRPHPLLQSRREKPESEGLGKRNGLGRTRKNWRAVLQSLHCTKETINETKHQSVRLRADGRSRDSLRRLLIPRRIFARPNVEFYPIRISHRFVRDHETNEHRRIYRRATRRFNRLGAFVADHGEHL